MASVDCFRRVVGARERCQGNNALAELEGKTRLAKVRLEGRRQSGLQFKLRLVPGESWANFRRWKELNFAPQTGQTSGPIDVAPN